MSGFLGLRGFPGGGRQLAHPAHRPFAELRKYVQEGRAARKRLVTSDARRREHTVSAMIRPSVGAEAQQYSQDQQARPEPNQRAPAHLIRSSYRLNRRMLRSSSL